MARALLGKEPLRLGGASFMRLLFRLGEALDACTEANTIERVIHGDPERLHGTAWGVVFSMLMVSPDYLRRALSLTQKGVEQSIRANTLAAMNHLRLLSYAACTSPEEHEPSLFGRELSAPMRSYFRHRTLDPAQKLAALVSGFTERRALWDILDVDWFRNPRAAEYFLAPRQAPAQALFDAETLFQVFEEPLA
jgi:hypothetical protein